MVRVMLIKSITAWIKFDVNAVSVKMSRYICLTYTKTSFSVHHGHGQGHRHGAAVIASAN